MARHSGVVALFLLGAALCAPGCGGQSVLGEGEGDPTVYDGGAFGLDGGTGGVGGATGGVGGATGQVGSSGGVGGATGGVGGSGGVGGATGGVGGSGGVGGTTGAAPGIGGSSGVGADGAGAQGAFGGSAGAAGSGGSGGTDYYGNYVPSCDLQLALSKSCARTGCHSAIDHYADLDFSNLTAIPAMLLDQPALHGDINCAAVGMPFRECMPNELPATCVPNALLIDSANPENSWILKKLRGDESCGDAMPLPPGNSVSNGWNEARRLCIEDYIYWIATTQAGSRSGAD